MSAVAQRQPEIIESAPGQIVPLAPSTPMQMLATAIDRGMSPEVIDKLMTLGDRWDQNNARKEFFKAFAAFKSEAITIARNKDITDGPLKGKKYAELFSFVDAVTPALSRNGLSASWELTKDEPAWIEVTCIIEHVNGHSKRVAMGGPPDSGGAKNAIQARVSTVTYLERQTLKAACGVAERGDDNDGGKASGKAVSAEQAKALCDLIETKIVGTEARLLRWARVEKIEDIPAARYDEAMEKLHSVKAS
jgi:hypothetical protein